MDAQQNAFLKLVVPAAQLAHLRWNVPASVTIAQAILESSTPLLGWGQSQLAREANNYFGIKAEHLDDPNSYIELPTHEYVHGVDRLEEADFARYETVADSFDAHARLLAEAPRYRPAMAMAKDPYMFCMALERCGYSTSPTYAASLQKLIRLYDLTQYDTPPAGPAAAREAAA